MNSHCLRETRCIFPSCRTEGNESELKRNLSWEMNTQGYKKGSTEIVFLFKAIFCVSCSKSILCRYPCLCLVRFCTRHRHTMCMGFVCCICKWVTKVNKLAVLTCRLEGGALEEPWTSAAPDEVLETAFDFPCEVPVAQLNRVEIWNQHLWGERFKRRQFSSTASIAAYKNFRGDEIHIMIQYCL